MLGLNLLVNASEELNPRIAHWGLRVPFASAELWNCCNGWEGWFLGTDGAYPVLSGAAFGVKRARGRNLY